MNDIPCKGFQFVRETWGNPSWKWKRGEWSAEVIKFALRHQISFWPRTTALQWWKFLVEIKADSKLNGRCGEKKFCYILVVVQLIHSLTQADMSYDVRSRNFQIAETTTRRLWVFNITLRPSEVVTRSVKFKHNLTSGAEMSSIPPFWADVYSRNLRDKENGLRLWTCTFPTQLPSFAPTWKKYQNISLESALIFQTVL